jgi:hypothetical protein
VRAHQSGGDVLGLRSASRRAQLAIVILDLDRRQQRLQQPLAVAQPDLLRPRRRDPFGIDPRAAQHASTRRRRG